MAELSLADLKLDDVSRGALVRAVLGNPQVSELRLTSLVNDD
jgi:hypothetical protein